MKRLALSTLAALAFASVAQAAEPFLKPGDVIAFVGGEDMVAAAEYGYLELLLTRALPEHRLRFRSLAWEGDTVFEQRRDLNYPTLEQQLDQIGATVVLAQFGQMESLSGKEKLPEFIAAYEKLIARIRKGQGRRVLIVIPPRLAQSSALDPDDHAQIEQHRQRFSNNQEDFNVYCSAIREMVSVPGIEYMSEVKGARAFANLSVFDLSDVGVDDVMVQRDGLHLNEAGHRYSAFNFIIQMGLAGLETRPHMPDPSFTDPATAAPTPVVSLASQGKFLALIREKNRLWFHYCRPQNWAFLAGDRTNQPSSRDHIDREKRWFPAELEQFLPLIEKKEAEIAALAAQLSKP